MGNPIKMDDLGVPLFQETPIFAMSLYFSSVRTADWNHCSLPSKQMEGSNWHNVGGAVRNHPAARHQGSFEIEILIILDLLYIPSGEIM